MKKAFAVFLVFFFLATFYLLRATYTYAVCPVCTIAVGAGLGLSRYLGIDDTVSGLWVGGLILSSSLWFIDWVGKKRNKALSTNYQLLATISMYLFVLVPLWLGKVIGHPYNRIFGIDKLVLGTVIGSIIFLGAVWADKKVRQIKGHQLFSYQRVIFPVASLIIGSIIMYLVLRIMNYGK